MTDEEFIGVLQRQSTETLLSGVIMDLCWLGNPKPYVVRTAGSWTVKLSVAELERLIELAKRGLK